MTEKIRKPIGKRKKLPQFTIMNVIEGQAGLENYSSLFFYSLTIDNILNIIVLLILAGVAISLTVGDNGLFRRAQNAADTWELAEQNEQGEMDKAADMIGWYSENTATNVADAIKQNSPYKNDTTITDDLDNEVKIPAGFKLASDSATAVEDGIVIEDKDGNQFVWIPAKTGAGATINLTSGGTAIIIYDRTDFGKQVGSYDDYTESMPSDEEKSVNENGGYFIGRYEAGDKESTEKETMRVSGESQTNTISIKEGQAPYNYITLDNAKALVERMDEKQNYTTSTTKLVSSYAWDTAINFIQIKNSDYGTNSIEGNYLNTEFTYKDINKVKQKKNKNEDVIIPTGQTKDVSNIYDMGGNLWEYTTESKSLENAHYTSRGGIWNLDSSDYPAGFRSGTGGIEHDYDGFRVALYL